MADLKFSTLNINLGYPGVQALVPSNPFMPDGTVNIFLLIRGGGGVNFANQTGLNSIIITADTKGLSLEIAKQFGSIQFVNDVISKVLEAVSKSFGRSVRLGKFGLGSFSAGYAAVNVILANRSQLSYTLNGQKIPFTINNLFLFDGLHNKLQDPSMKPYLDFAKESIKDPSKTFTILHSAVKTPYTSTTESSQFLIDQLGLQRKQNAEGLTYGQGNKTVAPTSIASKGGLKIIQVFDDKSKQPALMQHGYIGSIIPEVLKNNLANQWNSKTNAPTKSIVPVKNEDLAQKIDEFLRQIG